MNRRLGGAQPGNRFVSFVRAYARSGCLVELDLKSCRLPFFLFPFGTGSFPFSFLGPGSFPFSPSPHPPKTSYPTLVGLIGHRFIDYLEASPLPLAPLAVAGFMVVGLVGWQYSDRLAGLLGFAVWFLCC